MPKITQYTQQNLPNQMLRARRATSADTGGLEAQAIGQLGQAAGQLQAHLEQVQERRDRSEYERMMAEHKVQVMQRSMELGQQEFEPGADLLEVYGAEYQTLNEELAARIPASQKQRFEVDSARIGGQFQLSGGKDAMERAAVRAKTNLAETVTTAENMIAMNPDAHQEALASVVAQIDAMPLNGAEKEAEYFVRSEQLLEAQAMSRINKNPDAFLAAAEAGEYVDLPDLAGKIAKAKTAKAQNTEAAEKAMLEATRAELSTQLDNEQKFIADFDDPASGLTYDQRVAQINEAELKGQVRDSWAVKARRMLTSRKELNAITDSPLMAGVVTQMYDLIASSEFSPDEFLEGKANLQEKMMDLRTEGKLSREDYMKLDKTLTNLMSKRTSEATVDVAMSFGAANVLIEQTLPPEMRGEAVRQLFYSTLDARDQLKTSKEGRLTLQQVYKQQAQRIVDQINLQRRDAAIKAIDEIETFDEGAFLEERGYTEDDIQGMLDSAPGYTRAEMIQYLREQSK